MARFLTGKNEHKSMWLAGSIEKPFTAFILVDSFTYFLLGIEDKNFPSDAKGAASVVSFFASFLC